MSDLLIQQLKHESRLHHKSGAHGLGNLFNRAAAEIESLRYQINNPKEDNGKATR